MRLELQKIRVEGDNNQDRGAEGSEMSTDLTHAKMLAPNASIMKPPISKVYPKVNLDLPERWPLCNSVPPCAHYHAQANNQILQSSENPILLYDEEVKSLNNGRVLKEKSKFNSSNRLASKEEINQILTPNKKIYSSIPREFEQDFQDQQKDSGFKSYAEGGFVSPKLSNLVARGKIIYHNLGNVATESVSVPFNFTSEDANGRSSIYSNSAQDMQNSRSRRLWKAGASIISGGLNSPVEKTTTVRIRGKQTGIISVKMTLIP